MRDQICDWGIWGSYRCREIWAEPRIVCIARWCM